MEDSILDTIKAMLGVNSTDVGFDTDILVAINTAIGTLQQIGIGPTPTYSVATKDQTWINYLPVIADYPNVKTYIYLKVKLMFDPPASATILNAFQSQIAELEFRLSISPTNL